ncbi:hypothetical protein F5Y13DRAFT_169063 [Hypoxylon sp. FL1857]|nr:hypothetical protein F5Y13DRAFT_169063 [Hypoxylon sp. FL1857]
MFASWKPVTNSDGSNVFLCKRPHTFDPVTAKTERPVACSQCRAQKVRCTGERTAEGCERCQTLRRKCTYTPRRSSPGSIPAEEAPGFTDTDLQPGSPGLPTPAPTEGHRGSVSSASTDSTSHEWMHESHGHYTHGIDLSNFQLGHEFTRYSAFALMGNCEVQSASGQILATQEHEHSLFRNPQHAEIYSGASEPPENSSPRAQSRLPQAESLFPSQTQARDGGDAPRSSGSDCQCLHHVVILMDELELLGEPTNTHPPIDGILVAHRKALHQAEDMLTCTSCVTRVENMTILTFLVSKLTDMCCRAMSALSSYGTAGEPPPIASPSGAGKAPATTIGAYRLESEAEYVAVVRVLLRLGLDRLLNLVSTLQGVGRRLGSETMGRRLGVCKRTIGGLLDGR